MMASFVIVWGMSHGNHGKDFWGMSHGYHGNHGKDFLECHTEITEITERIFGNVTRKSRKGFLGMSHGNHGKDFEGCYMESTEKTCAALSFFFCDFCDFRVTLCYHHPSL